MIFKINAENRLKQGEYPLFKTASLRAIKDDENNEAYGVISVTFDMTPYTSLFSSSLIALRLAVWNKGYSPCLNLFSALILNINC